MLMPSIFNNNLFDDDWFGFPFYGYADKAENRAEKKLYGHHANNLMKTDIKEMKDGYELEIDLPGFKKDEVTAELKDGYLTVSAAKGLDQDEQEKETGRYIRRNVTQEHVREVTMLVKISQKKISKQNLNMVF